MNAAPGARRRRWAFALAATIAVAILGFTFHVLTQACPLQAGQLGGLASVADRIDRHYGLVALVSRGRSHLAAGAG